MAKQEMRDKADDHESVQGQESNLSRGPTISLILGVVSLGILGLFFSLFGVSSDFSGKFGFYDRDILLTGVFIGGPVATVVGVVGLVFGIKGVRSKYAKRGYAVKGIILCVIGIILGIVMSFGLVILPHPLGGWGN